MTAGSTPSGAEPVGVRLEDLERAHVVRILRDNHGNKAQAARALGIHRRKLYRILERFDIQPDEIQAS